MKPLLRSDHGRMGTPHTPRPHGTPRASWPSGRPHASWASGMRHALRTHGLAHALPPRGRRAPAALLIHLAAPALLLAVLAAPARSQGEEAARNWGNDPFMQLRADDTACPEPRGPRMTASEWRAEAHWRIETGTSCWLAGRCADANAYRYDAAIAQALLPRLQALPELAGSSVWAYLQRRILFVQGCVADRAQARAVEAAIGRAAAAVPELQMVVPALRMAGDEGTPYRRLDAR
jgi:hypothetical protein